MSFSVSIGETVSSASLYTPTQRFAPAYEVAMDVLMHPRIGEWQTWQRKRNFVRAMRGRGETLAAGAEEVLDQVLDGNHPRLGYVPSKWRLLLTTWPYQVRRLWRRYLGRDNLYIAAAGDFDRRALAALVESTLGRWRRSQDPRRLWITRAPVLRPGAFLVRKQVPGAAVVLAHHIPIDRTAPEADHAALEMIEALLGDGFRSRLMHRLRVEEGLTYAVSTRIEHEDRPGVPGLFRVAYQTRTGQVFRSITCVIAEIERLRREEMPRALIDEQLDVWRNREAFLYAHPEANVARLVFYELDDRPFDQDRRRMAALERVTPADVLQAAQRYLRPEHLTFAVFGSLSDAEETQIKERFGLKVLRREEIFRGGYE